MVCDSSSLYKGHDITSSLDHHSAIEEGGTIIRPLCHAMTISLITPQIRKDVNHLAYPPFSSHEKLIVLVQPFLNYNRWKKRVKIEFPLAPGCGLYGTT